MTMYGFLVSVEVQGGNERRFQGLLQGQFLQPACSTGLCLETKDKTKKRLNKKTDKLMLTYC